jgi:hypothetical protein
MRHAEIDRLWSVWQASRAGQHPPLAVASTGTRPTNRAQTALVTTNLELWTLNLQWDGCVPRADTSRDRRAALSAP